MYNNEIGGFSVEAEDSSMLKLVFLFMDKKYNGNLLLITYELVCVEMKPTRNERE
jgi:hypothetical protein